MSNKLKKNKTKTETKTNKNENLNNFPLLKKIYDFLLKQQNKDAKKVSMTNSIISNIIVNSLLIFIIFKLSEKITFCICGILYCIISSLFSGFKIYKKDNKKLQIASIIIQSIFVIIYMSLLF